MTRYINTASIILILPIFLAPVWLFGYSFCLPLILLVLYRNYDGLIKLNPAAKSNEPAIDDPLLTIVLSLGVSAFMNFPLTAYLPVVLYAAFAAAIILCGLLLFLRPVLSREARDTFFMAVSLGEVFIFALSFCIFTNCHFDHSHPIYTHQAVVTGMRNGHARSIDPFHLRLQRTDSREAIMYVDVPNSIYFNLDKGDTVLASFKQGLLNGNWYEVRKAGKKE